MSNVSTLFTRSVPLVWRYRNDMADKPQSLRAQFVVLNGASFDAVQPYITDELAARFGFNAATVTAGEFLARMTSVYDAESHAEMMKFLNSTEDKLGLRRPVLACKRHGGLPSVYALRSTPAQRYMLDAVWVDGVDVDYTRRATHMFLAEVGTPDGLQFLAYRLQRGNNESGKPCIYLSAATEGGWELFFADGNTVLNKGVVLDPAKNYALSVAPMGTHGIMMQVHQAGRSKVLVQALYPALDGDDAEHYARLFSAGSLNELLAAANDVPFIDSVWQDTLTTLAALRNAETATAAVLAGGQPQRPSASIPRDKLLRGQANVVRFGAKKPD